MEWYVYWGETYLILLSSFLQQSSVVLSCFHSDHLLETLLRYDKIAVSMTFLVSTHNSGGFFYFFSFFFSLKTQILNMSYLSLVGKVMHRKFAWGEIALQLRAQLGFRQTGFKYWLYFVIITWPWLCYQISLNLSLSSGDWG